MIKDSLCRTSLPINLCRGRCYDGASVMSGNISGVKQKIAGDEPRAVYVHCLAHSLNLALQDSARNLPTYRDMIEYTKDIINMIRLSPNRSAILSTFQDDSALGSVKHTNLRPLCPTRWTTRHESINSILQNYTAVQDTLAEVAAHDKSEAETKANGLHATMCKFTFYISVVTGLRIFARTEALCKTLQGKSMTVAAAVQAAKLTHSNIQHMREDNAWSSLWTSCVNEAASFEVDPPCAPQPHRPSPTLFFLDPGKGISRLPTIETDATARQQAYRERDNCHRSLSDLHCTWRGTV